MATATPAPTKTLAAGNYTIEATTYGEDKTGHFTLDVSTGGGGDGSTVAPVAKKAQGPVRRGGWSFPPAGW